MEEPRPSREEPQSSRPAESLDFSTQGYVHMARIAAAVASESSLEGVARAITEQLVQTGAAMAHIFRYDEASGKLTLLWAAGVSMNSIEKLSVISLDAPLLVSAAVKTGRIQIHDKTHPLAPELSLARILAEEASAKALASLPLYVAGRCFGALTIGYVEEKEFAPLETEALEAMAEVFALGMANAIARTELAESNRRFNEIIDNAPVSMALVGLDGSFVRANRSLREMFGYTLAELSSLRFQDITHPDDLSASLRLMERLAKGEASHYQVAKRYLHRNGTIIHAILNGSVVRDWRGKPLYFISQIVDVTEAQKRETELQASEERFRLMAENARDIIFRWSVADRAFQFVSGAFFDLLGYRPEQLMQDANLILRLLSKESLALLNARVKSLDGAFSPALVHVKRSDGEVMCFEVRMTPVHDSGGLAAVEGIARDVTEREKAEKALNESEKRLAFVASHAPGVIFYQDTSLHFTWFARYEPPFSEWALGKNDFELFPLQDAARISFLKRRVLERGKGEHAEIPLEVDGQMHVFEAWHEPRFDTAGNVVGVAGYWTDNTRRVETERLLRLNEERLRQAQEIAQIGSWYWDLTTDRIDWSDETYRIFGFERERPPLSYASFLSMVYPDDREPLEQRIRNALASHGGYSFRHRILLPDGSERVLYAKAAVVGEPGVPERLVGTVQDITERYRKEQEREQLLHALDAEKRWLDALIAQSPSGVILVKEDGTILFNQRLSELFGVEIDPNLGVAQFEKYFFDVRGQPLTKDRQPGPRVLKGEVIRTGEFMVKRPDGSEVFILGSGAPIYDQAKKLVGAIGIIEDITDRVRWEKTREQWMAIIAHDLRQPLATIMARADLLAHREQKPESQRDLAAIRASSQLMNRMIGDMLDASLIEASQLALLRVMVDVSTIVRTTVEHFAACGAPISVHAGRENAHAFADRQRIEQVMGNLLSNAVKYGRKKMPIDVRVSQDSGGVRVEVTNRGEVALTEASHVFERYYRTGDSKRRGIDGTGLGLYIVKGIVEAHGGKVGLRSEHGTTTVWFSLPKYPAEGELNPPA